METQYSPELDKTPQYILRLDDPGADPITAIIKPSKLLEKIDSAFQMQKSNREKAISSTLIVTNKIAPRTVIKVPSAEDTHYYQVLEQPKKNKNPNSHPNTIWVKKILAENITETLKHNSVATLDNLQLTDDVRQKLSL